MLYRVSHAPHILQQDYTEAGMPTRSASATSQTHVLFSMLTDLASCSGTCQAWSWTLRSSRWSARCAAAAA